MWQLGIDEAGYGPILGPMVVTAVGMSRPGTLRADDPWTLLGAVHQPTHSDPLGWAPDAPFCIADSKRLHRGRHRFARLEFQTLPILWHWLNQNRSFLSLLKELTVPGLPSDLEVPCYRADLQLPISLDVQLVAQRAHLWQQRLRQADLHMTRPRVFILFPQAINAALDDHGTKAVLPLVAWRELLRAWWRQFPHELRRGSILPSEPGEIWCDRLGGRKFYAAILCEALAGWHLQHYRETASRCRYTFLFPLDAEASATARPTRQPASADDASSRPGNWHQVTILVTPRAETQAFVVALASMVSKYIREVFLYHWNRYWQTYLPHLRPTAGYPSDGRRFLNEIDPIRRRLGLPENTLRRFR